MSQDYLDETTLGVPQREDIADPFSDAPQVPLRSAPALAYSNQFQQILNQYASHANPLLNASAELLALCVSVPRMPKPEDMYVFRQSLANAIARLRDRIAKLDYPVSVADKCCFLFCIALDEFIQYSDWGESSHWENQPLLSELFGMRNGGEQFYQVTDKALAQPNLLSDMIELIYVLLQLGFRGQYRDSGQAQFDMRLRRIESLLPSAEQRPTLTLEIDPEKRRYSRPSAPASSGLPLALFAFAMILLWAGSATWYAETAPQRAKGFNQLSEFTRNHQLQSQEKVFSYKSSEDEFDSVPEQPTVSPTIGPFGVQVATFRFKQQTSVFIQRHQLAKYQPQVRGIPGQYRIILPQPDKSAAVKLTLQLRREGITDAFVVANLGEARDNN